ncbi:Rieske (2Fe-2S) protein [Streptomyces venezuelae]|uniref:Cytochrome bc1 complex Rieske iron-sulfur subunit n=1 Tax=Streptomyces venezuelae TaxID=54571 RepID=A0A5P2DBY8_STRVZ|nr:Rieske (2Fe-2S) protein [Streptomyces venezuelae]QES52685.1 Rieske (2Fe-2S) protein [Streptomyces venezuelae]
MSDPTRTARRTVLAVGAAALAGGALTACGEAKQPTPGTEPATPPPTGKPLTTKADVPVGGGTIFKEEKVVVTQPEAGTFKAFSAICTHQGCTVAKVANGTIDCPCHGSKFKVSDGAVAHGPATRPLPPRTITVSGDEITLA